MTRYDFLDATFVIWLAIDLLLLLVNIWFWAKNDQIWQPEARWMIFCNIRTDFNFIFGQFSAARKLILNGGAIRPIGLLFFCRSSLMGTTLRATPSKSYAFSTNYHACIAMPTWPRCAPPILCWPWPPYNLLPRSCLTCFFFVDPHWWVPLYVQRPVKAMHFQQIIMHALQCQHDLDVHLIFCVDLDLHITSSRGHV